MYFDADKYTIKDILNIVLNPEVRLTWDDSVREMELIEKVDEYIDTYYMLLNIPFPFQNREFLQKRVKFEEDGTFYMYFSTIPSDVQYIYIYIYYRHTTDFPLQNILGVQLIWAESNCKELVTK